MPVIIQDDAITRIERLAFVMRWDYLMAFGAIGELWRAAQNARVAEATGDDILFFCRVRDPEVGARLLVALQDKLVRFIRKVGDDQYLIVGNERQIENIERSRARAAEKARSRWGKPAAAKRSGDPSAQADATSDGCCSSAAAEPEHPKSDAAAVPQHSRGSAGAVPEQCTDDAAAMPVLYQAIPGRKSASGKTRDTLQNAHSSARARARKGAGDPPEVDGPEPPAPPAADPPEPAPPAADPDRDRRAARWFDATRRKFNPHAQRPTRAELATWAEDFRALHDEDGLEQGVVEEVAEWALRSEFWVGVVHTPALLRQHWNKITGQMQRRTSGY